MLLLLVILLVIVVIGGLPTWQWHPYGYAPSSLLGVVVVILIVLLFLGYL